MRTLLTFGLGALAMYLLDPQQGRRRRALLQDQLTHARTVLRKPRSTIGAQLDRPSEAPESTQHLGR